jgi:hypothetical protein
MDELDDLLDPGVKKESSGGNFSGEAQLPNANATLVLGILSIVGCFLYMLPGLICGIIALSLHMKDKAIYNSDPSRYANSFKNAKAGFVCAIIGTCLSGLFLLLLIIGFVTGAGLYRF